MEIKVKVLFNFKDRENENKRRVIGDVFTCSEERAEYLSKKGAVEILKEEVVEETVEESEEETVNEEKKVYKKRKK